MDTNFSALKFFRGLEYFIDQDYLDLLRKISEGKYFYFGKFPLIDTSSPEEVSWAITRELPDLFRYSFWNGKVLQFQNIFVCSREPTEYVFRLDSRHGLNEIFQKNLPEIPYFRLNCVQDVDTRISYNFYVLSSKEIFLQLFALFYSWLNAITAENIDD